MSALPRVGWIGLGIMGQPMAMRLLRAGYPLQVTARRHISAEPLLKAGARWHDTPQQLAEHCDAVILTVNDTPDVEALLFGDAGIAQAESFHGVVVDMSTISPLATRDFAQRLSKLDIAYLDAPVSGGEIGAINGELTIMVGGDADTLNSLMPLFQQLGQRITHIGEHGAGQLAKTCNQIVVAQTLNALGDVLRLCNATGVNPENVRNALLGGFAYSKILEHHGKKLLEEDFTPGFKTALHAKDLNIALSTLEHLGLHSPGTELAADALHQLLQQQRGNDDSLSLATVAPTCKSPKN